MQQLFDSILDESRNEVSREPKTCTDSELTRGIATIQRRWFERQGTQAEHKQYKKIMDEILRRRKERQK